MLTEIKVPALGESVTEATVAKWYKKPGDMVKTDEILVELETDKVTLEVSAPNGGVLKEITSPQGKSVTIGTILGYIEGEAASSSKNTDSNKEQKNLVENNTTTTKQDNDLASSSSITAHCGNEKHVAHPSPSATKVINEFKLDVNNIVGTGKEGRITKSDASKVAMDTRQLTAPQLVNNANYTMQSLKVEGKREEKVEMTRLRKTIAKRLKDSQNTAAILTTFNEIDLSKIIEIRQSYQNDFQKQHSIKLGFMSFFIKAAVSALKAFPVVNSEIEGESIIYKHYYDIGVAVGTDNGLVVPIIRNVDKLSFAEVEKEISRLGTLARENKLTMADMSGGTFSITNGGIYGSLLSTPIINPPQSAILGMHNIVQRPVVVDNQIVIRPMMYVALSYDHRIVDGKESVQFLAKIKGLLESPEKILLDM